MSRLTRTIPAAMTTLLAIGLGACASDRVLVSHNEPHAIVVSTQARLAHEIYPVTVTVIDGRNLPSQRSAYWLAPGEHKLEVSAVITDFTGADREIYHGRDPSRGDLLVNLEAGKRYILGARMKAGDRGDWEPFVVRVEDI